MNSLGFKDNRHTTHALDACLPVSLSLWSPSDNVKRGNTVVKIVDVAEYYAEEGGGIKTYIQSKMRAGAAAGHEVVVVAPGTDDYEETRFGGRIRWVKGPRMPFDDRYGVMWNMKKIHRILDEEQPDILEGSSAWAGGQFVARWGGDAVKTLIFHQDAVAVIPHTYLDRFMSQRKVDQLFNPIWAYLRHISRRYDATIVAGEWLGARLDEFGVHNPIAVPFGIDKSVFSPTKRSEAKRVELLASCGRPPECPLLLTVSRFHPEKRLRTLFNAVRLINESQPVALVVFGAGYMSKSLKALAENTPGIRLAGYTKDREELAQVYASADLMLHGSAAETFGLGVAEAICSGLPVIGPTVGGAADLVSEGCGLLYPPGKAKACAAQTLEALTRTHGSWQNALSARADKINTVDQHFEQLFERYQDLLQSR